MNFPIGQESYSHNIHASVTREWFNNTNFNSEGYWISVEQGDNSDVDGFVGQGQGNYMVFGDSGERRIDNPLNDGNWTAFNNPEFPISPSSNGSSSAGLWVSHTWDEGFDQTLNTPSIHWKQNISMPVNMSDYIITSASLEVIFNATVTANGSDPIAPQAGGIERPGDYTDGDDDIEPRTFPEPPQFSVGDFATFYVLISDIENNNVFQVAINKTTDLGQDEGEITNYTDTLLDVIPENVLKSYLTSVLEEDNFNFTITLGIDIYCEDNDYNVDIDIWNSLIMRSFNLTFKYKKKIDQFTTVALEQVGEQISGENVQITDAEFNFEYKINQTWPYNSSPNSEIRFFVNNKQYNETIKLNRATEIFQDAFQDNIDITSFISKNVSITLSIQVYLADEFGLEEDILISIDNVDFQITYIVVESNISEEPFISRILLIIASIIGIVVGGYLVAYQRILKYPKPVRKVRKYKRTLRKGKPSVEVLDRKKSFEKEFKKEMHNTSNFLKGKPTAVVIPTKGIEKVEPNQPSGSKKLPETNKNI
ncbi:MAG: hypothetical protein ACFFFT_14000 [Candidatus Thorarchaeota archaeon]